MAPHGETNGQQSGGEGARAVATEASRAPEGGQVHRTGEIDYPESCLLRKSDYSSYGEPSRLATHNVSHQPDRVAKGTFIFPATPP